MHLSRWSIMVYRSIADAGLLAGGTCGNQGRQTCFFTAVGPLLEPDVHPSYKTGRPRMVSYRIKWERHQDSVHLFALKIAHDKRLSVQNSSRTISDWNFGQTVPNAISPNDLMLAGLLDTSGPLQPRDLCTTRASQSRKSLQKMITK